MVIQEPEHHSSYLALVGVKLGGSRFGSSRLEDGIHQEDFCTLFSLVFLDPFVKLDSVICSSSQHTHVSCFGFGFRFLV